MSVYHSGKDTTPGDQTNLNALSPGVEYIFQYKAPGFVFSFITPEQLTGIIEGWIKLRSKLTTLETGEVLTVTGVLIDDRSGDIFIRASVAGPPQVMEAGVNPWVVASAIAALFAAIGIGISLLYVYNVAGELTGRNGASGGPQLDVCTETGVIAYVKCAAKKSAWVAGGLAIGVLLTLVLFVVLVGRVDKV